ncbi:hypothetical protein [Azospirillum halopraeferens]|uniref:hypothetical protein n=1 Tax=Azospirillum halopraeferens TaxID=34010 RepID=UPI001B3BA1AC|nr:hypothetical protein [Azospirillum halopraeferens]
MTRRNTLPHLLAILLPALCGPLLLPPAGAAAADAVGADRLEACVKLAETRPDKAMEQALAWAARGGGAPAGLCRAMAQFHRGDFADAARGLEALVPDLGADSPAGAASLLGRAGWAWLRAGDAERAERAYTAALDRLPDDPDLRIDRAFARAEAERFWDAIADLDAAIAADPRRADAWLYRAAAHKALSHYARADADVARALELRPNDPEAVLLRANVKALSGDLRGARDDWALVRRLDPDGTAARAAAANLQRTAAAAAPAPAPAPAPATPDRAPPR